MPGPNNEKVRETDTVAWKEAVNADARRAAFGGGTPSPAIRLDSGFVDLPAVVVAKAVGEARQNIGLTDLDLSG